MSRYRAHCRHGAGGSKQWWVMKEVRIYRRLGGLEILERGNLIFLADDNLVMDDK